MDKWLERGGWREVVGERWNTLERCFDSFSTAVLLQRRVLECSSLTASTTACSPSVAYTVVTTCNHQDQCHHMNVTTCMSPRAPPHLLVYMTVLEMVSLKHLLLRSW